MRSPGLRKLKYWLKDMATLERTDKARDTLKKWPNRLAGLSHALFLSRIDRYMTINRQNRKRKNSITAYDIRNSLGKRSVLLDLLDELLPLSRVIMH